MSGTALMTPPASDLSSMAREDDEDASPAPPTRVPRGDHADHRAPSHRHPRGGQRSVLSANSGARPVSANRPLAVESAKNETGYIASCAALARPMAVLPAAAHLQEA